MAPSPPSPDAIAGSPMTAMREMHAVMVFIRPSLLTRLCVSMNVGHHDLYGALIDRLMCSVRQLDEDLVQSGREPLDDDRHAAAVRPVPRGAVNDDMNVANARRDA